MKQGLESHSHEDGAVGPGMGTSVYMSQLPLAGRAHFPFLPKTEYVINSAKLRPNPASVGAGRTEWSRAELSGGLEWRSNTGLARWLSMAHSPAV